MQVFQDVRIVVFSYYGEVDSGTFPEIDGQKILSVLDHLDSLFKALDDIRMSFMAFNHLLHHLLNAVLHGFTP